MRLCALEMKCINGPCVKTRVPIYEATASMSAQDVLYGSVVDASSFSTYFLPCRYDIKIFELPTNGYLSGSNE
jgi:hypothetical protein